MQWKYLWLVLLFAFSSANGAENEDYKICAVGGYFSGADDRFLAAWPRISRQRKRFSLIRYVSQCGRMLMRLEYITPKRGKLKAMQRV